jgi:hypothetical protein
MTDLIKTLRPFSDLYLRAREFGHELDSTCEWRISCRDLKAAHDAYEEASSLAASRIDTADEVDAKADEKAASGRWVPRHVERLIDSALANIKTEYDWYCSGVQSVDSAARYLDCIDQHADILWHEVKANRGTDKTAEVNARYVAVHAIRYLNHTAAGFASIDNALAAVRTEVMQATARFAPMNSPHEAYAVLLEEIDELKEHRFAYPKSVDAGVEARQVAAMAVRYLVDICSGIRRV